MKNLLLTALVLLGLIFVSQAQTHTIGEKFGGGIVFDVTADGLHGLIAETIDQGKGQQTEAAALIANPANHSEEGKAFTDWRLPKKDEMFKLWNNRVKFTGFANSLYWCSEIITTSNGNMGPLVQFVPIKTKSSIVSYNKPSAMPACIRSIRAF